MKFKVVIVTLGLPIALFGAYLFYFADCGQVKEFWFLTQVPGRCI